MQRRFRGDRLADARRRNGLSQAQLAEAIGAAGRERVSQWERGIEQPQPKQLRAVADVLGVEPEELLDVGEAARTLRDLRVTAGMSLKDAHTAARLPYTSYYRLETGAGVAEPKPELLAAVANALGVDVSIVQSAIRRTREGRAAETRGGQ